MAKRKKPHHKVDPPEEKFPRGGKKATQVERDSIAWHIRLLDKQGPWGWDELDSKTVWNQIHSKMRNFETMTWPEILKGGSHQIEVSELCSEAQQRLVDIQQDDVDELISLRLTGVMRLWGIRDRNILKILWWDPTHSVCLAPKKYT